MLSLENKNTKVNDVNNIMSSKSGLKLRLKGSSIN